MEGGVRARAVHVCVHVTDNDTLTASKLSQKQGKPVWIQFRSECT